MVDSPDMRPAVGTKVIPNRRESLRMRQLEPDSEGFAPIEVGPYRPQRPIYIEVVESP